MLLLIHLDYFKKYFIRIAKLYICMVLVNIRNIYVKYYHCGPVHFKIIVIMGMEAYQRLNLTQQVFMSVHEKQLYIGIRLYLNDLTYLTIYVYTLYVSLY